MVWECDMVKKFEPMPKLLTDGRFGPPGAYSVHGVQATQARPGSKNFYGQCVNTLIEKHLQRIIH